jgi:hypothetical protein
VARGGPASPSKRAIAACMSIRSSPRPAAAIIWGLSGLDEELAPLPFLECWIPWTMDVWRWCPYVDFAELRGGSTTPPVLDRDRGPRVRGDARGSGSGVVFSEEGSARLCVGWRNEAESKAGGRTVWSHSGSSSSLAEDLEGNFADSWGLSGADCDGTARVHIVSSYPLETRLLVSLHAM